MTKFLYWNGPVPMGCSPRFRSSAFSGMMNQKRKLSTIRVGFLVVILSVSSSILTALPQMSFGRARKLFDAGLTGSWMRLRLQTTSSTRIGSPLWNLTPLRILTIVVFGSGVVQLRASSGTARPLLSYFTSVSYIA